MSYLLSNTHMYGRPSKMAKHIDYLRRFGTVTEVTFGGAKILPDQKLTETSPSVSYLPSDIHACGRQIKTTEWIKFFRLFGTVIKVTSEGAKILLDQKLTETSPNVTYLLSNNHTYGRQIKMAERLDFLRQIETATEFMFVGAKISLDQKSTETSLKVRFLVSDNHAYGRQIKKAERIDFLRRYGTVKGVTSRGAKILLDQKLTDTSPNVRYMLSDTHTYGCQIKMAERIDFL